MTESNLTQELSSRSKKLTFAVPRIVSSILLGIVGFALFFLYNLAYNVNSILTGIGVGIGYFAIAAGQFLLGWFSDGKYTRWGRRKPYILVFAPVNAISFVLVLMPTLFLPNPDEMTLFIWLVIWHGVFRFSYAYTTVYQAWMPEQFVVDERPKVSQYQNIFNMIGQGIMLIFTFLVLTNVQNQITANPDVIPLDFLIIVFVFAILLIIVFSLATKIMPTEPYKEIKSNYIYHLKVIFKHKNYLLVTLMQGIASFAWIMTTTVMLNYIEIVLNFGTVEYLIAGLCLLFGTIGFLSVWMRIIKKKGKKQTLLFVFLFAMVFLSLSLLGLFPFVSPVNVIFGLIFMLGIAAILAGWGLFPYIYYADLAEDAEKNSGELIAGIYVGFPSILLNIFQALGTMLLGVILALPAIGAATYSFGYIIWGPICTGFLIVAYLFTRKYITLDFEWENK
ncbi:MAG: MFS transporter [Candidatus Hodarchaeota archaeon]